MVGGASVCGDSWGLSTGGGFRRSYEDLTICLIKSEAQHAQQDAAADLDLDPSTSICKDSKIIFFSVRRFPPFLIS